ncbi:MAG: hypothetical protein JJ974_12065, partial [Phycisphaerales bacterium]|nr:hypothetical protein [Phycisphaerales bacterium]
MNSSKRTLWIAFWIGVVLVVTALSWVSVTVYALEERNATARAVNQRQEVIRLSLWRMDSRLAPMIALEAARPIEDYEMVLGDPQGAKNTFDDSEQESAQIIDPASYAQGYFEVDQSGLAKGTDQRIQQIASKALMDDDPARVDTQSLSAFSDASNKVMSESSNADAVDESPVSDAMMTPPNPREEPDPESDFQARQKIADLAQNTSMNQSRKRAAGDEYAGYMRTKDNGSANTAMVVPELLKTQRESIDGTDEESESLGEHESGSRQSNSAMMSDRMFDPEQEPIRVELGAEKVDESQIEIGAIEPRWIRDEQGNPELVLVRTINRDGGVSIQGVLLDWDTISTELIASIKDLLPTSTLEPILEPNLTAGSTERSYRLATIPVAFIPGGAIAVDGDSLTPAMI